MITTHTWKGDKKMGRIPKIGERTLVMGILNVTPDSFSDGGRYNSLEGAIQQACKLVEAGADILDIGGESTRPNAPAISLDEELERVIPVITAIRKEIDVPISIDTYKAEVANQAILAGADIINDIWRGIGDPEMPKVAADHQVPIILMHNRQNKNYHHLLTDMKQDLEESISLMKQAGLNEELIWIDPGIGFAKTYEDNLYVMAHLEELVNMGYPVLLATSRKSFIGLTLDLPVEERLEGTLATVCLGIQKGCHIVRVHDVLETVRAARMMDTMLSKGGVSHG